MGPAWTRAARGEVFLVNDMAPRSAGPTTRRTPPGSGVGSSLSIPLPFQGATIGALNNYARRPGAFTEPDLAWARRWPPSSRSPSRNAEAAARATDDVANMRRAMVSRAVIEQAKGILMERYKVTAEQAFTLLTARLAARATSSCATSPRSSPAPGCCAAAEPPGALAARDRIRA